MPQVEAKSALRSSEAQILGLMIETVQKDVERVETTVRSIDEKMDALADLKAQQSSNTEALGRAFDALKEHDERITNIEEHMPGLKEARGWVIGMFALCVFCVLVAVYELVTHAKSDPAETAAHVSEAVHP